MPQITCDIVKCKHNFDCVCRADKIDLSLNHVMVNGEPFLYLQCNYNSEEENQCLK